MQKMMGVQKHSKFARKFCLPPFLGQRDSWIIYTIIICYNKELGLRHHLRLSSSGLGLPCTGADCLKEEASTYFSLSSSAFSVTGSTSRILFWVSIGKRWRGILRPCSNNSLLFIWWQLYLPVTGFKIFSVGEKQFRCKLTAKRNCCQVNLDLENQNRM